MWESGCNCYLGNMLTDVSFGLVRSEVEREAVRGRPTL